MHILSLSNSATYQSHLILGRHVGGACLEMQATTRLKNSEEQKLLQFTIYLHSARSRSPVWSSHQKEFPTRIPPLPQSSSSGFVFPHTKMFRPAGRALLRHSPLRPSFARPGFTNAARSLGSAAPKKSSLKSVAVRWALAGGVVYWYATSNIFANEPQCSFSHPLSCLKY